jgi:dipeptidyl aminopeptidase/acylaminoacyl peptidase
MPYHSILRKTTLIALIAAGTFSLHAQNVTPEQKAQIDSVLNSMPRARGISQVAVSPDGTQVAWLSQGRIHLSPVDGGAEQNIAVPEQRRPRDIAWSADSKQLAFLADILGEKPEAEVYTAGVGGGTPTKVTDLKGYVDDPQFSPDGKTLAVLFIEGMPRIAGPLQPMEPLAGVIEEKIYEQRITTIDLANNEVKQVTPDDVYVYQYDWLPNGSGWAVSAAHGSGDNNWWIARLYTADAQSGQLREIYKPKWQIADPRVSPDGKSVAFIEGLMSDEGSTGGDVYVVPVAGGTARNLTPAMKASATSLQWTGAQTITFGENIDGEAGLATVSSSGGSVQQLSHAPETMVAQHGFGASFSSDGKVSAAVRQSASTPPELWAGPTGQWKQITNLNSGVKPAWGKVENVHWNNGPLKVQGWLMFPANYDPSKKYPLVVSVHGGPSAACTNGWAARNGALSALGYFELCPNPRGSYGQGESYTQGNVKDFGGGDFKDIMAGVDSLAKQYPIDTKRLGVHGHSYGGYMTMWTETQTHRFAAAVAGAGLSNWLSYYGQNDIDQWMIPFFGASVYDNPQVYAKSDPMHFVKNVKTPTLIIVGDRDGEVPASQSVEWWHALKTLNVPTQLVVYPNEGHAIGRDPAHALDYQRRTLEWFAEYFGKVKD